MTITIPKNHSRGYELNILYIFILIQISSSSQCAREFTIDVETIQKCFSSLHGKELLKIAGEATKALRPPVSFIPTVTLDGDQRRQKMMLKDLMSEICEVLKIGGMVPKACEAT